MAPGRRRRPAGSLAGEARRGGAGRGSDRGEGDGSPAEDGPAEQARDPEQAARGICLRLLTLQPRTRAELAEALHARGIPAAAAEAVLERFAEVGLVDDAAFAQAWVGSRHRGRGLGRRALAQELGRRGVDRETARAALGQIDESTEEATARALVARRLPALARHPGEVQARRLVGMLLRKGYPGGLASRVVRDAVAEADGDAAEGPFLDGIDGIDGTDGTEGG